MPYAILYEQAVQLNSRASRIAASLLVHETAVPTKGHGSSSFDACGEQLPASRMPAATDLRLCSGRHADCPH